MDRRNFGQDFVKLFKSCLKSLLELFNKKAKCQAFKEGTCDEFKEQFILRV